MDGCLPSMCQTLGQFPEQEEEERGDEKEKEDQEKRRGEGRELAFRTLVCGKCF